MKRVAHLWRTLAFALAALALSACPGPEHDIFWTKLTPDNFDSDAPQLLLKKSDFLSVFSDAYVLNATDTLIQNLTPFFTVEQFNFGADQGFGLFKKCIPPAGPYTCWTDSNGFCFCERYDVKGGAFDSLQVKLPPCKLTFNAKGKFSCGGNCKTGSCTMIITTNAKKEIREIGCTCLVQLPEKIQLKNLLTLPK